MIRLANAPCSWGVLEFGMEGETADAPRFLRELKQAGFVGTELGDWGFMPTDPADLEELLDEHELPLVGGFVPVAFADPDAHAEGEARARKTSSLMGCVSVDARVVLADDNGGDPHRTARAGRIRPGDGLSDEQMGVFAAGVERIARAVYDQSYLPSVFHHHCGGFIETSAEVDALLDRLDPDLVGLCFDTGHWAFANGADSVVEDLERLRDRVWHVHFKDCSAEVAERSRRKEWDYFESVGNGVFCELGEGSVDFPAVCDVLRRTNYRNWIVVEQDVLPGMGSPLASATRNREYLRSIGL